VEVFQVSLIDVMADDNMHIERSSNCTKREGRAVHVNVMEVYGWLEASGQPYAPIAITPVKETVWTI
jgi:hypothetical protein